MMSKLSRAMVWGVVCAAIGPGMAAAQGRGGAVWTTSGGDAQRTSSVRTDPKISKDSLSKPGFQFLWKQKLETQPRGQHALTQPVFSTSGYITYKGFKGLVYVGGASDHVYSLDYDLNKMFWTTHLATAATTAGTAACPGGLTSITRDTRAAAGLPAGAPAGAAAIYTVSSGGMMHILNPQTGADMTPPLKMFASANAKVIGTLLAGNMLYVATADNCGGVKNGVYAMNLAPTPPPETTGRPTGPVAPDMKPASAAVMSWTSNGGSISGSTGLSLGTDGTVYVATADGVQSATAFSDAVVALDAKTLKQKDYFTPGKSPFTSSPVTFQFGGKDLVAAGNQDGRVYLLDSTSLGGADHKTPLSSASAVAGGPVRALSTFEDADGTRWVFAATPGAIVALKVIAQNGAPSLQPGWVSTAMAAPVTPTIVNGVVFALASGEPPQVPAARRPTRPTNAVLYALDATTGKELWNSGTAIGSIVHGIGPAADDSQIYVVGVDGTLYAFGFVVDR